MLTLFKRLLYKKLVLATDFTRSCLDSELGDARYDEQLISLVENGETYGFKVVSVPRWMKYNIREDNDYGYEEVVECHRTFR
jgi:hypothetical protein